MSENAKEIFEHGIKLLADDNIDRALKAFDKAYKFEKDNARYMSYYGMCKALRGGEIGLGLELCTRAIKKEFFKPEHYVNLARVYIAAGNKKGAFKVLLKGLKHDPANAVINKMLVDLGFRHKPVIPALDRTNPLNKFLGILLRRMIPGIAGKKRR
ncbi:MAG: hypothetical protein AABY51_09200 [Deltaproteobacteria bacterium]